MSYPYPRDFLSTQGKRKYVSRLGRRHLESDSKPRASMYERSHTEDSKLARKSLWWNRENEPPQRLSSIPLSSSLKPDLLSRASVSTRSFLLSKLQSNNFRLTDAKPVRDELNDSGHSVREFLRNEAAVVGGHVEEEEGVLPLEGWSQAQSNPDLYQQYSKVRVEASTARENVRKAQASLNQALYAYEECTARADSLLTRLMSEKGVTVEDEVTLPEDSDHADLMDMTELYMGQRAVPSSCYTPASLRHRIKQQIKQINDKSPCYVIDE